MRKWTLWMTFLALVLVVGTAPVLAAPKGQIVIALDTDTPTMDPHGHQERVGHNVGWHLFGDTHKRGGFMAGLGEDLRRAGIQGSAELPDHLTQVLALVGREEPTRASALAEVVAPAIATVRRALDARKSPYAHVLAAVQDAVGGLRAEGEEVTRP